MQQPDYKSIAFDDHDLDAIYNNLNSTVKGEVDAAVKEALYWQGYTNIRPGGERWLRVQRKVMRSFLCDSEDRERDSEVGV